jgi:hypothetical protein
MRLPLGALIALSLMIAGGTLGLALAGARLDPNAIAHDLEALLDRS